MTTQPQPPDAREDARERYWKPNLVAASSAIFAVAFGQSSTNPFLPIFLNRDLGITDPGQLALWSGICAAAASLAAAIASPFWGIAADRLGRRSMLVRAVLGAAIFTAAVSLVQSAAQLAALRLMLGVAAGVNPAGLALVASETPKRHLGRALGVLSSARALGQSVGPALGGLAGSVLPLRFVYLGAGLVQIGGVGPVLLRLHETNPPRRGQKRSSAHEVLRAAGGGVGSAIVVVIAGQALMQLAFSAAQQLIVLRMIQVQPEAAALGAGFSFAAISGATVLAASVYPGAVQWAGFRWLAITGGLVLGLGMAGAAQATSLTSLVATGAVIGLGYGVLNPSTSSMLGLEAPSEVKSTIFGLSSSAQGFATAGGALIGGVAAAALGTAGGLFALALAGACGAAVLWIWGREPPALR